MHLVSCRLVPCLSFLLLAACAENERSAFDPAANDEPPELLGVEVETNDAQTAVYVRWEASEPVRAVVEYGNGADLHRHSYSAVEVFASNGRTRLLAAEPNHVYDWQIRMWDQAGNEVSVVPDVDSLVTPATLMDEPLMLIAMVDVGWGDAIYLEVPQSDPEAGFQNVLIDAGHPLDGLVVRDFLEARDVFALDFAGLSHIHEDHIGGFYGDNFAARDGLIREQGGGNAVFPIGTFIDAANKTDESGGPYSNLLTALALLEVSGDLGDYVQLGWGASSETEDALKWGRAKVDMLSAGEKEYLLPDQALAENAGSVINNDSIVYRVQYGGFVAILTGDAEFASEQFVQDHWSPNFARAQLLKLGHHGSNDSNSERWVDFVKPTIGFIPNAIIENPGVEHPYVLQRLRNRNIDYYASDRAIPNLDRAEPAVRGDILLYTDGGDYTIVVENIRRL